MQTVSITAQDDGTFAVEDAAQGMDTGMGMPTDMQAAPGGMPPGNTYESLDEALEAARVLLGGDAGAPAGAMMEGEADFLAGFKGANGSQGV